MFDINLFKKPASNTYRYDKRITRLKDNGISTTCIEKAIAGAVDNLGKGVRSFVIYGDPQSGKTEMMIALTAKLLDKGLKVILVLLNDNVELLKQNLRRFRTSGIDPDPKNFTEVTDPSVVIGDHEWVIFCKKNSRDLKKVLEKIGSVERKVIIDDEADYASPNSKINKGEVTRINGLIESLLGKDGFYIGVTATPARLDLNNTFSNANDRWVHFPAHDEYTGQAIFFPIRLTEELKFNLNLLPDHGDHPQHLRNALFDFFITVAHLNTEVNKGEKNYCMLIHTSGKKVDHSEDYKQVIQVINILKDSTGKNFERYVKELWERSSNKFKHEAVANSIVSYVLKNITRNTVVVMNSSVDKKNVDYDAATSPNVPFTIAIGGNIISRGVTFRNLLSMFFTRDVKHKIQQDTYIQRARMFGSRGEYVKYFELSIPENLYLDWHRCFVFHSLALESIKSGNGCPVWLENERISSVASGSIDKTTVVVDSGEMGFEVFDYGQNIENIISGALNNTKSNLEVLKELNSMLGNAKIPQFLIDYIQHFSPHADKSIAFHKSFDISGYRDANQERIERARGFIGTVELEKQKFPEAIHHFKVFYNARNKARVYYKFIGNIKFLKNLGKP